MNHEYDALKYKILYRVTLAAFGMMLVLNAGLLAKLSRWL
jgi:hypothetical protein